MTIITKYTARASATEVAMKLSSRARRMALLKCSHSSLLYYMWHMHEAVAEKHRKDES